MLVRNMSTHVTEMADKISPKNTEQYHCKICDFKGSRYSEYKRHITTAKHIKLTNADKNITTNVIQHICSCGKEFGHRQSLHRHKQNCNGIQINTVSATVTTPVPSTNNDLINVIVKQQEETTELKKLLIEQQDTHFKQMKEQQQQQIQEQQEQHNKQIQELIQRLGAPRREGTVL